MGNVVERAEKLRAELQRTKDFLPAYSAAQPLITLATGIALAQLIRDLAVQVEALERWEQLDR